jgi:phage shock protein C
MMSGHHSPETGFGSENSSPEVFSSETAGPSAGQTREGKRLLRRSKHDRVIAGVAGGLGRYLDVDPVLFRIAFILLLVPGGIGLIIYIISWIAMPEFKTVEDEIADSQKKPMDRRMGGTLVGGLLIIFSAMILLQQFIDWFDPRIIGGGVLILIGAVIVIRGLSND